MKTPSAFSIPQADARPDRAALITQADVDALLIQDWGVPGRKQQIQKWYRDGLTDQELEGTAPLRLQPFPGHCSPRTGGNLPWLTAQKGMPTMWLPVCVLRTTKNGGWREISYEEMARHIRVLIDTDRYLTPAEREAAEKRNHRHRKQNPMPLPLPVPPFRLTPQAAIDEGPPGVERRPGKQTPRCRPHGSSRPRQGDGGFPAGRVR